MHLGHGTVGIVLGGEGDETEATASSSHAIDDDLGADDVESAKGFMQGVVGGTPGEVANKKAAFIIVPLGLILVVTWLFLLLGGHGARS